MDVFDIFTHCDQDEITTISVGDIFNFIPLQEHIFIWIQNLWSVGF